MTLLKYCTRDSSGLPTENWANIENFEIPSMPKEIDLTYIDKESIKVNTDNLMYSFDLNDEGI